MADRRAAMPTIPAGQLTHGDGEVKESGSGRPLQLHTKWQENRVDLCQDCARERDRDAITFAREGRDLIEDAQQHCSGDGPQQASWD